ncbi:hypothetical protein V5O48_016576 [Marasmius crinis-equi]|uniref:Uncharacterized protein n=1 Tax=Marasmius crinis-equi TaxID=585013 RepID=A0ABR3ERC5_9AGAR
MQGPFIMPAIFTATAVPTVPERLANLYEGVYPRSIVLLKIGFSLPIFQLTESCVSHVSVSMTWTPTPLQCHFSNTSSFLNIPPAMPVAWLNSTQPKLSYTSLPAYARSHLQSYVVWED